MGNSQQLCERKSLSVSCPHSMRTRPASCQQVNTAIVSLPRRWVIVTQPPNIQALSFWMSQGCCPLSSLKEEGQRGTSVWLGEAWCCLACMKTGQRESPGQGDAMPPFRSWLLRPVARSPQKSRDKAESQGGSEEAGLGGSEFAKQALSQGHRVLTQKLCS